MLKTVFLQNFRSPYYSNHETTLPFETPFLLYDTKLCKKCLSSSPWGLVKHSREFSWFGIKSKSSRNATPVLPTAVAEMDGKCNFPKIYL